MPIIDPYSREAVNTGIEEYLIKHNLDKTTENVNSAIMIYFYKLLKPELDRERIASNQS